MVNQWTRDWEKREMKIRDGESEDKWEKRGGGRGGDEWMERVGGRFRKRVKGI